AALDHRLADAGGEVGEGVLDDAHAADAHLQLVQYARTGEHTVEPPHRSPHDHLSRFADGAADAGEEALERAVVEQLLVEVAVLLDEVVQDVEADARVGDAADEGGHRAREERDRPEELFLCATKAVQGHGTVAQTLEIGVVADAGAAEYLIRVGGHL